MTSGKDRTARYREKLKKNPEKWKQILEKDKIRKKMARESFKKKPSEEKKDVREATRLRVERFRKKKQLQLLLKPIHSVASVADDT